MTQLTTLRMSATGGALGMMVFPAKSISLKEIAEGEGEIAWRIAYGPG
jgi:hypothetical protein